jgi:hypothetical protein
MQTTTGTGASKNPLSGAAGTEAAERAKPRLGVAKPSYGFLFASPDIDLQEALKAARERSGAEMVGCTTAGEITEQGLAHQSVAVMLVSSGVTLQAKYSEGLKANPRKLAAELWSGIADVKKAAASPERDADRRRGRGRRAIRGDVCWRRGKGGLRCGCGSSCLRIGPVGAGR